MYIDVHCGMEEREAQDTMGFQRGQTWQFTTCKSRDVVMEREVRKGSKVWAPKDGGVARTD